MRFDNELTAHRRRVLQLLGISSVGVAATSVEAANHLPEISITDQTTDPDRSDTDDFPVPDAYKITIDSVAFEADNGTIALPVENSDGEPGVSGEDTFWYEARTDADGEPLPAFVVGVHSPAVGNGAPDSLSSLVGVRPLRPGEYTDVTVPIWAGPPPWQQSLGADPDQFPTDDDTIELTATIWYGPDVFPPTAERNSDAAIAQTPADEQNGPVTDSDGTPISSSAFVEFQSTPSITVGTQGLVPDPSDTDDFPVPDDYVLTLSEVDASERWFSDDELGTIALPVENSDGEPGVSGEDTFWYEAQTDAEGEPLPAFVVGVHSPAVGNGAPDSLSSLIGVRPVTPGEYTNLNVPIWAGPPPWQQSLGADPGQFPSQGDRLTLSVTIWYGPDVFPPTAERNSDAAIAQTPADERNGPVSAGGALVSDTAPVVVDPGVQNYTNEESVADEENLITAIKDWRAGRIDIELLLEVIYAWRSGDPVN